MRFANNSGRVARPLTLRDPPFPHIANPIAPNRSVKPPMFEVLSITSPIYLMMLLGYALTRAGLFSKSDMRVIGRFVLNLALPALLFNALVSRHVSEIFNPSYILSYLIGTLLVIGLGYWYTRRVQGASAVDASIYALGMSSSNTGFVGYPILLLLMPPVAGVALALNMMLENLVVIPLLLLLAEMGKNPGQFGPALRAALQRLARNPLIIGLGAGLLVSLSGWAPPSALTRTINMIAASSAALSLFVIGGTLVGLGQSRGLRQIWPIVGGKLIVHPLMVALALSILPWLGLPVLPNELFLAALLFSAMPMIGIYTTLAQSYGLEDVCAQATLVATVLSFFSVSALLWALHLNPAL